MDHPMMQRFWSAIETALRRYPWAITLLALIPCAYFDAAGVNHFVAANVFKSDVGALTRSSAPTAGDLAALAHPAASHHVRDSNQILARNVFDNDAGCLNCAPPPVAAEATDDAGVQG